MVDGESELDIAKHRSGKTGKVKLRFIKEFAKFENMVTDRGGDASPAYQNMMPNPNFDNPAGMGAGASVVTMPSSINSDIPVDNGEAPFCLTRPPRRAF